MWCHMQSTGSKARPVTKFFGSEAGLGERRNEEEEMVELNMGLNSPKQNVPREQALQASETKNLLNQSEQIPPPPSLQAVSEGVERPGKFPGCPHGNSSFQDSSPDSLGSSAGSINQLSK